MQRFKTSFWIISALAILLVAGCGGNGEQDTAVPSDNQAPSVQMIAPANQAILPAGQPIPISVIANDDQALLRIELYVDNSLIESRVMPSESTLTTVSEQFTWSASIIGPHTLQARAYDGTGQMGASPIVAVEVQLPGAQPTPPPGSATPEPTNPPSDATPVPPTEPPATATTAVPQVTANVNANVRTGPGLDYPAIGFLTEGQSAPVTGRNSDSSWWQINFQGSNGWIAGSVVAANDQAFGAPVAEAPPPPPTNTPSPPTATPTSAAPTNTPAPTTGLRIDQATLSAGQCTTLRWDFHNIKAIYLTLGPGYDAVGQPGVSTAQVCPSITTTYKATVVKTDDSQETHQVTANVSGTGCGDPYITQFAPTAYEVSANQPFSVFWQVDCAKGVWYIKGAIPEQPVPGHGQKIDETVTAETIFRLKVAKNSGGDVYASFTVRVK